VESVEAYRATLPKLVSPLPPPHATGGGGLALFLNQFDGVDWTQTFITVHADAGGWYPYEDYSANHSIEKHVMHVWYSTPGEDGQTFDLRIELDTDSDGSKDSQSNVVSVLVDNTPPNVALDIDLGVGVQCADFAPRAIFSGHLLHWPRRHRLPSSTRAACSPIYLPDTLVPGSTSSCRRWLLGNSLAVPTVRST
jgi:hypothetical protein